MGSHACTARVDNPLTLLLLLVTPHCPLQFASIKEAYRNAKTSLEAGVDAGDWPAVMTLAQGLDQVTSAKQKLFYSLVCGQCL
jgi:hypothetical protein